MLSCDHCCGVSGGTRPNSRDTPNGKSKRESFPVPPRERERHLHPFSICEALTNPDHLWILDSLEKIGFSVLPFSHKMERTGQWDKETEAIACFFMNYCVFRFN